VNSFINGPCELAISSSYVARTDTSDVRAFIAAYAASLDTSGGTDDDSDGVPGDDGAEGDATVPGPDPGDVGGCAATPSPVGGGPSGVIGIAACTLLLRRRRRA
jgi:hypothetical protein